MKKKYCFVIVVVLLPLFFIKDIKDMYLYYKITKMDNNFSLYYPKDIQDGFNKINLSVKKAAGKRSFIATQNLYASDVKDKISLSQKQIDDIKRAINDLYKISPVLNPLLFDDKVMKNEIRKSITGGAFNYIDYLLLNKFVEKNFKINDILLSGSMGGYLYHKNSDIDVQICVDRQTPLTNKEQYLLDIEVSNVFYSSLMSLQYNRYQEIYGLPVTYTITNCAFETNKEHSFPDMSGTYSLLQNKWIEKPKKISFLFSKKYLYDFIISYFNDYYKKVQKYNRLLKNNKDKDKNFCNKIDDNLLLYKKNRHSAFVYLNDEAYGFQNISTKIMENLKLSEKFYEMLYHCKNGDKKSINLDFNAAYKAKTKNRFNTGVKRVCSIKNFDEKAEEVFTKIIDEFLTPKEKKISLSKDVIKNKLFKLDELKILGAMSKILDMKIVSEKNNQSSDKVYISRQIYFVKKIDEDKKKYIIKEYKKAFRALEKEFNLSFSYINKNNIKVINLFRDIKQVKESVSLSKNEIYQKGIYSFKKLFNYIKNKNCCSCDKLDSNISFDKDIMEVVENTSIYKSYRYKKTMCRLRNISVGNYEDYKKLF